MQKDSQIPATQPSAILQPPRPPGPPTLTAIGLAPDLPDPDNSQQTDFNVRVEQPLHELATSIGRITEGAESPVAIRLGTVDKILAVTAAVVGIAVAIALWGMVLVKLLH